MRSIVVSGFAGTGKSTAGAAAASLLGLPFVDTDREIEARAGASARAIFRERGEGAFRALEREVVLEALAGPPRVLALGGGAVTAREVRFAALDRATVVTLTASVEAIVRRAGRDRPLLAGAEPARRVRELLDARADAYAERHAAIDTTHASIDDVARALAALADDDSLVVPLGQRSHVYRRVTGAPEALAAAVRALGPTSVFVVTDANVARARAGALDAVRAALAPLDVARVVLEAGETHKTLDGVRRVWDALLGAGADRAAVVVAFGGGVVGDLAGFAAATALRGLRWVQAPTSLLSMVDASVGGKTGFDHEAGKNRVGALHQPSGIVADLEHLETLPSREARGAMAEVVKIGVGASAELFDAVAGGAGAPELILPSVRAKIRIFRDDETDAAGRAVLNLGHTAGHALEAASRYSLGHGEAVAIGLVAELEAAARLGLGDAALAPLVIAALERRGLPTRAPAGLWLEAKARLAADKKREGARLHWPVVPAMGAARVETVDLDALRRALP